MTSNFRSSKIASLLAGFLVFAIAATVGSAVLIAREQSAKEWSTQLDNLSLLLAEQTAQEVRSAILVLNSIAEGVTVSGATTDDQLRLKMGTAAQFASMRDKTQGLPQVDVATIVAANGDVINFTRSHPAPSINLADRDYFQAHLQQPNLGIHVSRPVRNKGNGQWTFYLSRRLTGPKGEFLGLALVGFSSTFLSDFYNKINLGADATVTLYRRDYMVLARWPHDDKLMAELNPSGSSFKVIDGLKKLHGVVQIEGPRFSQGGERVSRLGAARLIDNFPLIINVTVTDQLYLAQWRRFSLALSLVGGISACAMLAAFMVLIRSLKCRERDLDRTRALQAEAEAASTAKSEFLAMMSHEIRTPLTAIIGFAEIIQRTVISGPASDAGSIIVRNGRHLLDIINGILDISKIEAGRMHLEYLPFSPVDVASGVETMMAAQAASKGIGFSLHVAYPFPAQVMGDPTRWKQILFNLTSNAVKFTELGAVALELEYNSEQQRLKLRVRDSGIGMSDDQLTMLFKPFSQADSSTARKYGGTGLGLHLVHQLATKMKGAVQVRSKLQQGAVFELEIHAPMVEQAGWVDSAPATLNAAREMAHDMLLSGHVLLAEDGPDNRLLIVSLLHRLGLTVEVVEDGAQAVQAALTGEFDLVLMDIQMPVMDGVQAATVLQGAGYGRPLVALTANVMQEDIEAYREAGFACSISKPIDVEVLARRLSQLLVQDISTAALGGLEDLPGYADIRRAFIDSLPASLQQLDAHLRQNSLHAAAELCHTLRGTGASFGYPGLSQLTAAIERAARAGNTDAARDAYAQLRALEELIDCKDC